MADQQKPEIISGVAYNKYVPWVTVICCMVCVVLFIGINAASDTNNWDNYRKWGAPSITDIWNGAYWGLLTSVFVHKAVWHIVFNVSWFWQFGKKIEFESPKIFFCLFILSSAYISSACELTFAGTTGIGLSGVVYSMFGYIFVMSKSAPQYENFMSKKVIYLFIVWLLLCIVLSALKIWQVGNAAHVAGLLWGALVGKLSKYSMAVKLSAAAFVISFLSATVVWQPWSVDWLSNKAHNLYLDSKFDQADVLCKKILSKDTSNTFAKQTLNAIQVYQLSTKAFAAHKDGRFEEARWFYTKILEIDPKNDWAKENISRLPQK
jgi:GlpG protein